MADIVHVSEQTGEDESAYEIENPSTCDMET